MQPRQRSTCSTSSGDSSPSCERPHQHDAAARRVHLLVPQVVRRARRQAEPAVHAVVEQLLDVHQTSSPGLQAPSGSKRSRTRRISSRSGPSGMSHGSMAGADGLGRVGDDARARPQPRRGRPPRPCRRGSRSQLVPTAARPTSSAPSSSASRASARQIGGQSRDADDQVAALARALRRPQRVVVLARPRRRSRGRARRRRRRRSGRAPRPRRAAQRTSSASASSGRWASSIARAWSASGSPQRTTAVAVRAGRGCSRTQTSVITPRVPNDAGGELGQVVAGDVLDHPPAAARDGAVGERERHPDHDVARRAVAVPQRAAVGASRRRRRSSRRRPAGRARASARPRRTSPGRPPAARPPPAPR